LSFAAFDTETALQQFLLNQASIYIFLEFPFITPSCDSYFFNLFHKV
jgi:hypothetical protein